VPTAKLAPTLFDRFGNWPFFGLTGLGILAALLTRTRKPKSR
jgi:apolipoprotein N-acyltransferase